MRNHPKRFHDEAPAITEIQWDKIFEGLQSPYFFEISYKALYDIIISLILGFIFSGFARQCAPRLLIFLCSYIGTTYLLLATTSDVCKFTFVTIYIFVGAFCLASLLKRLFRWKYHNVLVTVVFLNALFCFRKHTHQKNIDEFVITYIMLSTKLLSAARFYERIGGYPGLKIFTLFAYLMFPGWIHFKDLLMIPYTSFTRSKEWWITIAQTSVKALFTRYASEFLVTPEIFPPDRLLGYHILHLFNCVQYRAKYYFRATLIDLQGLAWGIQNIIPTRKFIHTYKDTDYFPGRGETDVVWMKNYTLDILASEMACHFMNFVAESNSLLISFLHKKFINKKNRISGAAWIHGSMLVFLVYTYNSYYAILIVAFVVSEMLHSNSRFLIEKMCGFCYYTCNSLTCNHIFNDNDFYTVTYFVLKCGMVTIQHWHMSLLFYRHPEENNTFNIWSNTALVLGIVFKVLWIVQKFKK